GAGQEGGEVRAEALEEVQVLEAPVRAALVGPAAALVGGEALAAEDLEGAAVAAANERMRSFAQSDARTLMFQLSSDVHGDNRTGCPKSQAAETFMKDAPDKALPLRGHVHLCPAAPRPMRLLSLEGAAH
ncbi:MAG: hypothetical protein ABWY12_12690, partial [Burkholderiales bacterium]